MGCCSSVHRVEEPDLQDSEAEGQVWRGGAFKSPEPQLVKEARFTGRNCGAPLADICLDAVQHVQNKGRVQEAHLKYARKNAKFIHGAFEMRPDPEAGWYVVVVRMKTGGEFDPMSFKKRMDCLLRNLHGVRRGEARNKVIVYPSGKGPSLQRLPHGGVTRAAPPHGTTGTLPAITPSVAAGALQPAQMKALLLQKGFSGEPWPMQILHGFLHYKGEAVLRKVLSNPCLPTACIYDQQPTRPIM